MADVPEQANAKVPEKIQIQSLQFGAETVKGFGARRPIKTGYLAQRQPPPPRVLSSDAEAQTDTELVVLLAC